MAVTIMGGLFVATFLTLFFLPAMYALWFRKSLGDRKAPQASTASATPLGFAPGLTAAAAE
jgi:hypothetical protein